MKVLWVCNCLPRTVAMAAGRNYGNKEGWLDGALGKLIQSSITDNDRDSIIPALAVPVHVQNKEISEYRHSDINMGSECVISLYEYGEDIDHPENYDPNLEQVFGKIVNDCRPDIVHVFGTEFPHTLAVSRVVYKLNVSGENIRLLIGLQGIISECALKYTDGLPRSVVYGKTFRDRIRKDNIASQQMKFIKRGEYETEAITYATDITGRTEFDRNWASSHNPKATYHHMNETMRKEFYEGTWDVTECDRHVIFMSQGDYSLKGLHKVLSVMPGIISRYPDARLRVAGIDIINKDPIRITYYGKYLSQLIKENSLADHVTMLGSLSAEQMKREYLNCNTFLIASSVENSPNSMGEAMLLGVPVVAARVGGVPSMADDNMEVMMFDDIGELPDILDKLWSDDGEATELGAAAMLKAGITHNAEDNLNRLLEIYEGIC
ncbi:MAG: glycosyltransferase family 4 protein [Lachnospiraceae bacterium]|nr:glycosyltransferase family 4 protein [Lachnospiraceae bacterium]